MKVIEHCSIKIGYVRHRVRHPTVTDYGDEEKTRIVRGAYQTLFKTDSGTIILLKTKKIMLLNLRARNITIPCTGPS